MTPDRKVVVNGKKVEEYYWAGEYVTYIENRLFNGSFDSAVKSLTIPAASIQGAEEGRGK